MSTDFPQPPKLTPLQLSTRFPENPLPQEIHTVSRAYYDQLDSAERELLIQLAREKKWNVYDGYDVMVFSYFGGA